MHYGAYLDWWQMGTYNDSDPLNFSATPGWEDVFAQKPVDSAFFYASKDNEFPTKDGGVRRINFGWAILLLHMGSIAGPQSLPRVVTFNPVARQLEQPPIDEVKQLRRTAAFTQKGLKIAAGQSTVLHLGAGVAKQSEFWASFVLPSSATTFGFTIGTLPSQGKVAALPGMAVGRLMTGYGMSGWGSYGRHNATAPSVCQVRCDADPDCVMWSFAGLPGSMQCLYNRNSIHRQCPVPSSQHSALGFKNTTRLPGCVGNTSYLKCSIDYTPFPTNGSAAAAAAAAFYEVPVSCGSSTDMLRLLPSEKSVELRVFSDHSFIEAFFQRGRVAMTVPTVPMSRSKYLSDTADMGVTASADIVADVTMFPMDSIWTSPEEVRAAKRVFPPLNTAAAADAL